MGHEVTVISLKSGQSPKVEVASDVKVYRTNNKLLNTIPIIGHSEYSFSFSAFLELISILKRKRFDVIHGNKLQPLFSFMFLKYFESIPCILTMHTPYSIHGPWDLETQKSMRISWLSNRIFLFPSYNTSEVICAKIASKVIAVSKSLSDILITWGISKDKIAVIYNGIDADWFSMKNVNRITKKELNLEGHIVLFVGRLEKRKGPDLLIRAAPYILKELKNVNFVFVGEDYGFKDFLVKEAREVGCLEKLFFVGKVSEADLVNFYASCDVLVAPSRYESFGLMVGEAMSMAKPVIATNIGGFKEIIQDGVDGFLFEPKSTASLAEKVISVLSDRQTACRIGKNARQKIIKNFNWKLAAEKTVQVYREALRDSLQSS
jgi:hypothetical protein